MRVLVTGATGFVGAALLSRLSAERVPCVAAGRRQGAVRFEGVTQVETGDISAQTNWRQALSGVDVVVHLAARVHVMRDAAVDPLAEYRRVNVQGSLHLARQAAAAGVKRFVFLSSIKVNGEATPAPHPPSTSSGQAEPLPGGAREKEREKEGGKFSADDVPAPQDPYGISKMEAEAGLREIAAQTGMEVVIIRPPLVYGPGVKANFAAMMRWLRRGVPLPLGAIHNQRSLVALDNLVDLITVCLRHPAAANQIFMASDGEDLSTAELIRRTARAMGVPARLVPVPVWLLEVGAALLGRRDMAQRLCGNLQVDISKTRQLLGWAPPVSVDEGLRRAVSGFQTSGDEDWRGC